MSTTTAPAPFRPAVSPDPSIAGIPFSRHLRVELRKLVDTRAGFWLLAAIGILTVAAVATYLFAVDPSELTYLNFVAVTATPQGMLLPVLGILAVTAEWSQRTGLVTFTQEPNRLRIVSAKLLALLVAGLAAVALSLAVAALGNVLGIALRDGAGTWNFEAAGVRDFVLVQLIGLVQGFAFGMLLMNTAAAIVLYFVLPIAWNILFTLVGGLADAAPWLDLNTALAPVFNGDTLAGNDWSHLAVSGTIWVLVPVALGLVRLLRREVK